MREVCASEAAGHCEGKLYGDDISLSRRWRSDSREVELGDAFVAIKGAVVDGHVYIQQAVDNGAKLILAASSEIEKMDVKALTSKGVSVIAVEDTVIGMAKLAQYYLREISPSVIGITGSVGKTTTRELLVSVLKKKYKVHSAIRSFNTVIGCALTVLSMAPATEMLVLELGTNHFGEISEMVGYFPPETVIITEVAPAHLEGFGSVEGVLGAKLEICKSAKLKNVIYNFDNQLLRDGVQTRCGEDINRISVGKSAGASLQIKNVTITLEDSGSSVTADLSDAGGCREYKAPLFGSQHAYNIGFAVAAAKMYGVAEYDIVCALVSSQAVKGRGVCKRTARGNWIIDEAYNANPASMSAAINNVVELNKDGKYKLHAALGGMRELGVSSAEWHSRILRQIKQFDAVALIGDEWYHNQLVVPSNAKRFKKLDEYDGYAVLNGGSNAVILIKGSNSYGLKNLVERLTENENVY